MEEIWNYIVQKASAIYEFQQKHKEVLALTSVFPIAWSAFKVVQRSVSFLRIKTDLHPFYTWKEVKEASQYFIETRGLTAEGLHAAEAKLKLPRSGKLIPYFTKKAFHQNEDDQRFYIILSDGGMGKTTFMINLYLRYSKKIFKKQFNVELMSLWHPKTWERLVNYPEEKAKNTLLLLDSLDEDPKALADINGRLNEIIDKVWLFRKIIICCNTQFFENQESEPSEIRIPYAGSSTGYHSFLKIYLAPFSKEDIIRYIKKRFSIFKLRERKAAVNLIKKSSSLMERPLLLSFIDDLIATKKKYEYAYEVYESLIDKWILRESNLLSHSVKKDVFRKELMILSKDFAFAVFMKYQRTNGFFLDEMELKTLIDSKQYFIDMSIFRTKSLITRNETGLFRFAHFSIFEFFLAQVAIDPHYNLSDKHLEGFKNAQIFYQELFWNKEVLPFFERSGGRVFTKMNNKEVEISKILANGNLEKVDNLFINGLKSISLIMLSPLKNILTLQAIDTPVESYESIANLKKLQTLNFENCDISDVKPLKFLTELSSLYLKNGKITEIDELAELTSLQYLNLENNQISDLTPLSGLTRLKRLSLVNNNITNLQPLKALQRLTFLYVAGNPVEESQIEELKMALPDCKIDVTSTYVFI